MSLLVDAVARFKQQHPYVRTVIEEKGSLDMVEDIRHDRLDIGLMIQYEEIRQHRSFIQQLKEALQPFQQ